MFVYANLAARELLGCRAEGGDLALSVRHPSVLDAIGYGVPSTNVEISGEPVERIPECGHSGVVVRVNDFGEGIDKEMIRGVSSGRGEKLTLLGKSF